MLHDIGRPLDQPPMEQVSSPLSSQILEFCESELFQETIQNSDVASASNCCYEEQSSYAKNLSFPHEMIKYPPSATNATTAVKNGSDNFATMFEEKIIENDNSLPLDFVNLPQYPFGDQDQFDLSQLQNQISFGCDGPIPPYPHPNDQTDIVSMMGSMFCEKDYISSLPPSKCMRLNYPSSSPNNCFLDLPYLPSRNANPILSMDNCGIFNNLLLANEIQTHELDFQGDNTGIFLSDALTSPYNSNKLQALSNESQHLINNGGGSCNPPLAPSEITSLESESFRVANKLTSEERKEKIHRYMKKRNVRNFSKKIKYACRKTLADSRPRVRGRFAKNDEFGEHHINSCNTHEEDTDEDVKYMNVKEEEKLDSLDIFAHISGLNSFRCNYPIQSWI